MAFSRVLGARRAALALADSMEALVAVPKAFFMAAPMVAIMAALMSEFLADFMAAEAGGTAGGRPAF